MNDYMWDERFIGFLDRGNGGRSADAEMSPQPRDAGMDGALGGVTPQALPSAIHLRAAEEEAAVEVGPPCSSERGQDGLSETSGTKAMQQSTARLEEIARVRNGAGGGTAAAAHGREEGRSADGLGDGSAASGSDGDVDNSNRRRLGILDENREGASHGGDKEWPWTGADVSILGCPLGVGAVGGELVPVQNAAVASRHTGKRSLAESSG